MKALPPFKKVPFKEPFLHLNKNNMNTAQIILSFDTVATNGKQLEPQLTEFNIKLSELAIKYFGSNKINLKIFDELWRELPL